MPLTARKRPGGFDPGNPDSGKTFLIFGSGNLQEMGHMQMSYAWLFKHLCDRGHKIVFYTFFDYEGREKLFYDLPDQVTVKTYKLDYSKKGLAALRAIADHEDPDAILCAFNWRILLWFAAAFSKTKYPVIFSERGNPDQALQYTWNSKQQRIIAHSAADFTHLLMPGAISALPEFLQPQITTIPSVTQPAKQFADTTTPDENGRYRVLYTGRLTAEKDVELLVESFARIARDFPDWNLHIHGDGPQEALIKNAIEATGLQDRIFLKGTAKAAGAVYDSYTAAHIFVLPSRSEGCPVSLREAMAHGLPVVGFEDCRGTNEIIVDGRNGFLVRADYKSARLSDALSDLMKDADLRHRLGLHGTKDIKAYRPQKIHAEWEEMLTRAARLKGIRKKLRRTGHFLHKPFKRSFGAWQLFWMKQLGHYLHSYVHAQSWGAHFRHVLTLPRGYLTLYGSALFSPVCYAKQNPDVKRSGQDPLRHYLTQGWKDGLAPSAYFDPQTYASDNMGDAAEECPLLHYYRKGRWDNARTAQTPIPEDIARRLQDEMKIDASPLARTMRKMMAWESLFLGVGRWARFDEKLLIVGKQIKSLIRTVGRLLPGAGQKIKAITAHKITLPRPAAKKSVDLQKTAKSESPVQPVVPKRNTKPGNDPENDNEALIQTLKAENEILRQKLQTLEAKLTEHHKAEQTELPLAKSA